MISHLRNAALAVAVAFAAPLASQPAAPAPDRIPAEALAELPFIRDPVLSPDGNRFAALMTLEDKNWIAVYDLRHNLEQQRPLLIEWGDWEVIWLRWAGNERLIFGIQTVAPFLDVEVPVTRAGAIDLRTGRTTPLIGGRGIVGDDVIYVDPAGAYVLLASQAVMTDYPSVDRIDLATGRAVMVQSSRQGVWDWFADTHGVVRAGVEYGPDRTRIYYRSGPEQEWRRMDTARSGRVGDVIDWIRFAPAGDRGYVATNEVTGRFGVYEFDFATGTRGAVVFEHPEVDVDHPLVSPDGALLGFTYEDDRPRARWIDPNMQRVQAIIDRALPGMSNAILGQSADGNKFLVRSSADNDPGTYLLYDRAARQVHGFANPYGRLNGYSFAAMRNVRYRSRDGLDIPAYLTLPPGRPERGLPLIVMPHGGPYARDGWGFDPWVQFLASRGYAVLQPNFRGSTGYGRDYVERGIGQFGTGMIDDMEDGIAWLAGQGTIDPARVCIMGASYGGYAAMWAPIRSPRLYRCAISFAGVADVRSILRYDSRFFTARRYYREWRRRIEGEPGSDLAAISPLQQAARLRVPVLIAHGERDRNVPVSHSRNMVRALTRAGASVESAFYAEERHGFSKPENSLDFLRRVEAFLARHNPAEAPAAPAASH